MSSSTFEADPEEYRRSKSVARYAWGQEGMGLNVWEAALERVRYVLDAYDHIALSFSGGKDSMAVLEATLAVTQEQGKTLTILHSDDEIVSPFTEEYVREVSRRPGIDFHWLCIPVKQRNAASQSEDAQWYPWGPEESHRFVREYPPEAITLADIADWYSDPLGVDGTGDGNRQDRPTFQQFMTFYVMHLFPTGRIAQLLGIRAGESLVRRKAVANDRVDNYIIREFARVDKVYPVYDWTTEDIWTAAAQFGWNYNETYDHMEMRGVPPSGQRVGTPFGNEAIGRLSEWAESYPEIWDKVVDRVDGAATAARYSRTELYAFDSLPPKPEGMEWMEFLKHLVDQHRDPKFRAHTFGRLQEIIKRHQRQTSDPILEYPHPISGASWKLLANIAMRGDAKDRKAALAQRGDPEKYALALNLHRQQQRDERRARRAQV